MRIKVTNPYYDAEYITNLTMEQWDKALHDYTKGESEVIYFKDEISDTWVTISPRNFASVEVS